MTSCYVSVSGSGRTPKIHSAEKREQQKEEDMRKESMTGLVELVRKLASFYRGNCADDPGNDHRRNFGQQRVVMFR